MLKTIFSFLDYKTINNLLKVDKFCFNFVSLQSQLQFTQKYPQLLNIIPTSPNWSLLLKDMDFFPALLLSNTRPLQCPLCHSLVYQKIVPNKDKMNEFLLIQNCKKCGFRWETELSRDCLYFNSCCEFFFQINTLEEWQAICQNSSRHERYVDGSCAECDLMLCEYHSTLCVSESKCSCPS